MIDKEQVQHMTDVAGECNRLNEISQPLGYAVTATTTVDDQSMQQFMIHRLDQTVASRPKFATIEEVLAHLEAIAKLPLWRLDLVNNSAIVFDPAEREITDPTTGESFSFRGWGLGVAQLAASGQGPGAQEGVTNLTVRSEESPDNRELVQIRRGVTSTRQRASAPSRQAALDRHDARPSGGPE